MGQMPQMPGVSQSGVNPNGNVLMQEADLLRRMSPVERQTVLQSLGDSGRGWFRGTPFRSPLQGGLKGLGRGGGGAKV